MPRLRLSIYGDDVLREKGKEVDDFDERLTTFLDDMIETMIVEG